MFTALRRTAALTFVCLSLTALPSLAGNAIGIVTGPKAGTYIALGKDIALVGKQAGLSVEVKESLGSIDNIKRITSKEKVSLGIVQSDVLGFLSRSKNAESVRIAEKLRMVFPLNNEEVHVLARKNITSFKDLTGKRVVVGTDGSGNMVTSINLFSVLGVTPAKMYQVEPPKGIVAVLNDQADAIIFVGGKPVKMFKNMEELAKITEGADAGKLNQVHFLALNDPKLLEEYAPAMITKDDYSYVSEPVPTIAVTSILMAHDFSPRSNSYRREQCRNIDRLAAALRSRIEALRAAGHPKWKEVNLNATVGFWKKDTCAWAEAKAPVEGSPAAGKPAEPLEEDLIGIIRNKPR